MIVYGFSSRDLKGQADARSVCSAVIEELGPGRRVRIFALGEPLGLADPEADEVQVADPTDLDQALKDLSETSALLVVAGKHSRHDTAYAPALGRILARRKSVAWSISLGIRFEETGLYLHSRLPQGDLNDLFDVSYLGRHASSLLHLWIREIGRDLESVYLLGIPYQGPGRLSFSSPDCRGCTLNSRKRVP